MTVSLERAPDRVTTPCPAWCDRAHDYRYETAPDLGTVDHYREIGRVDDGQTAIVVGISVTTVPGGYPLTPCVEVLHLDQTGAPPAELLGGDLYLSAAEAVALVPLLARAAQLLAGAAA